MKGEPYTKSLDLWTIGVLAYELASKQAPFSGKNEQETKSNIKNIKFKFPSKFSPKLQDFISRLLTFQELRMTIYEALSHPFITDTIKEEFVSL